MSSAGALHGLGDGTFRAHWLREVCRTPHVTESVKVLLLATGLNDMDDAGNFSVPREELAARIGRGNARVSERLQVAVEAGFLVRVAAGKKGRTAEYRAALPVGIGSGYADPIKGPDSRTETFFRSGLQDAENTDSVRVSGPNEAGKGPATRDANSYMGVEIEDDLSNSDASGLLNIEDHAKREPESRAKRKAAISGDFAITADMRGWAADKVPGLDIDFHTEQFVDYWISKGERRASWDRTWQMWMRNQKRWTDERANKPVNGRAAPRQQHQAWTSPKNENDYYKEI